MNKVEQQQVHREFSQKVRNNVFIEEQFYYSEVNVDNEYLYCSEQGFKHINKIHDDKDPDKNLKWTTDATIELPIVVKKRGLGALPPKTIIDCIQEILTSCPDAPCLSVENISLQQKDQITRNPSTTPQNQKESKNQTTKNQNEEDEDRSKLNQNQENVQKNSGISKNQEQQQSYNKNTSSNYYNNNNQNTKLWRTLSFREIFENAALFGRALIYCGVQKQQRVNILCASSVEWFVSFYGAVLAFNVPVALYEKSSPEICFYVAENSDCAVLVCDGEEHLRTFLPQWDRLPALRIIVIVGVNNFDLDQLVPIGRRQQVLTWAEFLRLGGQGEQIQREKDQVNNKGTSNNNNYQFQKKERDNLNQEDKKDVQNLNQKQQQQQPINSPESQNAQERSLQTQNEFSSSNSYQQQQKAEEKDTLEDRMRMTRPGHCCTIVYTSGTTGLPKGVMLSHDNCVWTAATMRNYFRVGVREQEQTRIVSYMPLSHMMAQITDVFGNVVHRAHIFVVSTKHSYFQTQKQQSLQLQQSSKINNNNNSAINKANSSYSPTNNTNSGNYSNKNAEVFTVKDRDLKNSVKQLVYILRQVKPTFFVGLPSVWEELQEYLLRRQAKFLQYRPVLWAQQKGAQGSFAECLKERAKLANYQQNKTTTQDGINNNNFKQQQAQTDNSNDKNDQTNNQKFPMFWTWAKSLVFDKMKSVLGLEKALSLVVGGAPLSLQTRKFFLQLNMNILNVYGLCESSGPETVQVPDTYTSFSDQDGYYELGHYLSSAGQPIEGTDLKIMRARRESSTTHNSSSQLQQQSTSNGLTSGARIIISNNNSSNSNNNSNNNSNDSNYFYNSYKKRNHNKVEGLSKNSSSNHPGKNSSSSSQLQQNRLQLGEICWRGRNRFMGYFKMEKDTRRAIDRNGFVHTGDLGFCDVRGNLCITGRIKELIVMKDGEHVAPAVIEQAVKDELGSILGHCVIVGEQRPYLSLLLVLRVVSAQAYDKMGGDANNNNYNSKKNNSQGSTNHNNSNQNGQISPSLSQSDTQANPNAAKSTAKQSNTSPNHTQNQQAQQSSNLNNNRIMTPFKQKSAKLFLHKEVIRQFRTAGSKAQSVAEAKQCDKVRKIIDTAIKRVNTRAASRAQQIQRWTILEQNFSVAGGELTPNFKLRRGATLAKYQAEVEAMYLEPKL